MDHQLRVFSGPTAGTNRVLDCYLSGGSGGAGFVPELAEVRSQTRSGNGGPSGLVMFILPSGMLRATYHTSLFTTLMNTSDWLSVFKYKCRCCPSQANEFRRNLLHRPKHEKLWSFSNVNHRFIYLFFR